jgi:hypothetical protein
LCVSDTDDDCDMADDVDAIDDTDEPAACGRYAGAQLLSLVVATGRPPLLFRLFWLSLESGRRGVADTAGTAAAAAAGTGCGVESPTLSNDRSSSSFCGVGFASTRPRGGGAGGDGEYEGGERGDSVTSTDVSRPKTSSIWKMWPPICSTCLVLRISGARVSAEFRAPASTAPLAELGLAADRLLPFAPFPRAAAAAAPPVRAGTSTSSTVVCDCLAP